MSNELTTITEPTDLAFVRTSKSGKKAVRGLMGLMSSGNKAERHSALDALVAYHWENGQYKPILREFSRVFHGKGFDAIVSILGIDLDKPNKLSMLDLFGALVRGTEGKTLKGEKLAYQGYAVDLLAKANAARALALAALEEVNASFNAARALAALEAANASFNTSQLTGDTLTAALKVEIANIE